MKKSWVIVFTTLLWVAMTGCSSSSQVWLDSPVQPNNRCGATFAAPNPAGAQAAHTGVDICPGAGAEILAVADGTLVWNQWWPAGTRPNGHGITAVVNHGGIYTYHAHMSKSNPDFQPGDHINQGDIIGWVGQTGYGTGPHIHFAISPRHPDEYEYGKWVVGTDWLDPDDYLGKTSSSRQSRISWWLVVLTGFLGLFWVVKHPKQSLDATGEAVLWLARPKPQLGFVLTEAFRGAMEWWIFTIVLLVVISDKVRLVIKVGFEVWVEGSTSNKTFLILFIALIANWLLRAAARVVKKGLEARKKTRSWAIRTIIILVVVMVVVIAVINLVPDFESMTLSDWLEMAKQVWLWISQLKGVDQQVIDQELEDWDRKIETVETIEEVVEVAEEVIKNFKEGASYLKFSDRSAGTDFLTAQPVIKKAAKKEGVDWRLLLAIWQTETLVADCDQYRDICPSKCCSPAGAKGPFQFMDGTWPSYSQPTWDRWDLYDSARATGRMVKALKLEDQSDRESFALRFSGLDGGLCWNYGATGAAQGRRVWDLWKAKWY